MSANLRLSVQPQHRASNTLQRRHTRLLRIRPCTAAAGSNRSADPTPIFSAAMAEPVSFLGGILAGFLALSVDQDPLRTWILEKSAEAGIEFQIAKERLVAEQQRQQPPAF